MHILHLVYLKIINESCLYVCNLDTVTSLIPGKSATHAGFVKPQVHAEPWGPLVFPYLLWSYFFFIVISEL